MKCNDCAFWPCCGYDGYCINHYSDLCDIDRTYVIGTGPNAGAIAGGVVGGLVGLVIIIGIIIKWRNRQAGNALGVNMAQNQTNSG